MIKNSDILSTVNLLLGNKDVQQVDDTVLREWLGIVFDRHLAQLQSTDQNWFLKIADDIFLSGDSVDYEGLPADFSKPIYAKFSTDNGQSYTPVDIVPFTELDDRNLISWPAIAFYGQPMVMRISGKASTPVRFTVYYYPDMIAGRDPEAKINVQQMFTSKIALETALKVIPYASIDPDQRTEMKAALVEEISEWRTMWNKFITRPKARGRIEKRPYIGGY